MKQRMKFMTRRQKIRFITDRLAEGLETDAIGREMGISGRAVRELAERHNLTLHTPNARRFAFFTGRRRSAVIMQLAETAEVSPSTIIDRIVSTVVDDGVDAAKKRLGTLAQPGHSKVVKS